MTVIATISDHLYGGHVTYLGKAEALCIPKYTQQHSTACSASKPYDVACTLQKGATYPLSSGFTAVGMLEPPPALLFFFGTGPRPRNSAHRVRPFSFEMPSLESLVTML